MSDINEIVAKLKQGETMLYPTDTILGLGCDAKNEAAIEKIYQIKNRPSSKSLIILVDSPRMLQNIVEVPELAWDLIDLNEKIEARNQEELEITHDSDTRYLCDKEGVFYSFQFIGAKRVTKAGKDKFYLIRVVTTHHFSK